MSYERDESKKIAANILSFTARNEEMMYHQITSGDSVRAGRQFRAYVNYIKRQVGSIKSNLENDGRIAQIMAELDEADEADDEPAEQLEERPHMYPCAVCGRKVMDTYEVESGYDTCTTCLPR